MRYYERVNKGGIKKALRHAGAQGSKVPYVSALKSFQDGRDPGAVIPLLRIL
jgi:hypothetical protein